jgi:hypothetical protein
MTAVLTKNNWSIAVYVMIYPALYLMSCVIPLLAMTKPKNPSKLGNVNLCGERKSARKTGYEIKRAAGDRHAIIISLLSHSIVKVLLVGENRSFFLGTL